MGQWAVMLGDWEGNCWPGGK